MFAFATTAHSGPAVLVDGRVRTLESLGAEAGWPAAPATMHAVLDAWDAWCEHVDAALESDDPASPDWIDVDDAELLAPVADPPTVYCAGANYVDHIEEMTGDRPDKAALAPYHFIVPTGSLTGHRAPIRRPAACKKLDWEIELAVVIGTRAENVPLAAALDHVAGYTVANDISMRDLALRTDVPFGVDWLRSKGYATCLPMGPAIVPARFVDDVHALALTLTVNGELMQDSSTAEMLFDVAEQIEYLSAIVPLLPGDVISTGTPAGVGFARDRFLEPGDVVVCEIEGIGRLENRVE